MMHHVVTPLFEILFRVSDSYLIQDTHEMYAILITLPVVEYYRIIVSFKLKLISNLFGVKYIYIYRILIFLDLVDHHL